MEIQLQFILTVCIVNYVWAFAQSENQMADQAVLSKVKDDCEIQEKFQNLFSSIVKNDAKKSETFHKILRQEDEKERQAFGAMNVALQQSANRNVYKKMHFYRKINDETVRANKREIHGHNCSNSSLGVKVARARTPVTALTSSSPTKRAYSLARKFKLSRDEVFKLRGLRSDISLLMMTYVTRETFRTRRSVNWITNKMKRRQTRIPNLNRRTKVTSKMYYKNKRTYPSHRDRRIMMYNHFVNLLSMNEEEKETFLTNTKQPAKKSTTCYWQAYTCFIQYCYYEHYWRTKGLKIMQDLLARACTAEWLTPKKIMYTLQSSCGKRFKYKVVPLA